MLTDLRLQNFRSYIDESFEFSPGVNIIVGPNASGKTNLLEAVLMIARGSSYRVKDSELVRFDQSWARLDCDLANNKKRSIKLKADAGLDKTYELEGKTYKRLSLQQTLPAVLFEPNHLQLLAGSPERRRDYIDDLLEQTVPGYGTTRRKYKRALAQRNALLKQTHKTSSEQFFAWNLRLSQLAGIIIRMRQELIVSINKDIEDLYKELSKTKDTLTIKHKNTWPVENYETQFLKKLEADFITDQQRGFTGSGPHREDILVLFDGRPAQEVASRGEVRTAILALKVTELKTIEQARSITPLFLLDDVFSELDAKRRHTLTDYLAPYQTFITTTDADLVLKRFAAECNIIPLGT
jgi:DNA replication and repair protein RecF